jgi:hypothetical protein
VSISIPPSDQFAAPAHCHIDASSNTEHTVDTLYVMMAQDFTKDSCCDYLHHVDNDDGVPNEFSVIGCYRITEDDRTKIVDWCYSVIDSCQLNRESVAMAMNIVDRFMSNPRRVSGNGISPRFSRREIHHDRVKYQLLAVSALYIAIKVNERVVLSSEELAAVSRGIYSKESIEAMECTILDCLSWRVCVPTALQVGNVIFELMIAKVKEANISIMACRIESIREELAYQTEIAVRDYQLALQRPSTVAFMAIMNAIEIERKVNDCEKEVLFKALAEILIHVKSLTSDV